jgi:uncharacterized membrane-anchored protein YhcB (DUF1043 family)
MAIQLFISGVIVGVLLGMLLCSRVLQRRQRSVGRQRDIDQLVAQFHELFRQLDRQKKQQP